MKIYVDSMNDSGETLQAETVAFRQNGRTETNTAYHEAGHAVAAICSGGKVDHVTIRPADDYLGYCRWTASADVTHLKRIQISVAGAIADYIGTKPGWKPEPGWRPSNADGASSDMEKVYVNLQELKNSTFKGMDIEPCDLFLPRVPSEYCCVCEMLLDKLIAETFAMLSLPKCRRTLDLLASVLLWRKEIANPRINRVIRDSMNFEIPPIFLIVPEFGFNSWDEMTALGGSYDAKRLSWLIPPSQESSLNRLEDKGDNLDGSCLPERIQFIQAQVS